MHIIMQMIIKNNGPKVTKKEIRNGNNDLLKNTNKYRETVMDTPKIRHENYYYINSKPELYDQLKCPI